MPMMRGIANYSWMSYPTQSIGISEAVLLMKNPPSYVSSIASNDTIQFHSDNITVLVFGMMPEDAANLTGTNPPSYASGDVFVIYGLVNPTLVMPSGAQVQVIFVNLDNDMYHNFVLTAAAPPYSSYPMQGMMGGGMMGGYSGGYGPYGSYMMPYVNPADYSTGMAYSSSYGLTLGSQTTLWYLCSYPGHAESGMYGKVIIAGSIESSSTTQTVGSGSVKSFEIYVSYLGFNGTSGNLDLNVKQGDSVSIKFVWNDTTLGFDNAHQLEVQGYGVISAVIDQGLPASVIQFTASKAGSFQINCIIPCEGMANLQNGWLIVAQA
jgi:rusticyanin